MAARTTIALRPPLRDRLLVLKRAWRLRSTDQVLERLLQGAPQGAKALYDANRATVDQALRNAGARRLIAFGSRARGDARPDSDLDLVAELPSDADLLVVTRLHHELERAFGLEVNLLTGGAVKGRLKERIDQEGIVLAEPA